MKTITIDTHPVRLGALGLTGELQRPDGASALVLFAHGSGSSRSSPRNQFVAALLQRHGLATLLFDLLTEDEAVDRRRVFDIDLLSRRLVEAVDGAGEAVARATGSAIGRRPVGLFGASTGAAAALSAAAERPDRVFAVVSRGGRGDLAAARLGQVRAPTLLIVGGDDTEVLALNRAVLRELECDKRLEVVPGATHLFEEPGALDAVARLAGEWFARHASRAEEIDP